MPLELALLPVIESAFEPYAYSRARASGLWQFIPGTGSRFGLKQNWWYDGRRDVVESTRAALDYLQSLHDEFNGDWLLAVAAYNCGELTVARAVQINQAGGSPNRFLESAAAGRDACLCAEAPRHEAPGGGPGELRARVHAHCQSALFRARRHPRTDRPARRGGDRRRDLR